MKKLLAMAAAMMLLLTFMPASAAEPNTDEILAAVEEFLQSEAAAEETQQKPEEVKYPDIRGSKYEDAVKLLDSHGVMTGYPDGTFRPEESITRSEFVTVLARLLSVAHIAKSMKLAEAPFGDVSKDYWAAREIQLITDKGILNGYEDETFRPDNIVTYAQVVKMLVGMLGYGESAEKKGGWPLGYMIAANEIGVIGDNDYTLNQPMKRGEVAALLQGALNVSKADGTYLADTLGEALYFVSPDGNDSNPGTEEKPWKTAQMAAATATAGTTVIFEDGEYVEQALTVVKHSGEEGAPITFKARNKHQAVIKYIAAFQVKQKFDIQKKNYINVRDLAFTQELPAKDGITAATADIYINAKNAKHVEFTGNKFWNVYEEGIKMTYVDHFLLDDNEVIDPTHEGFDVFCCSNGIVRNNRFINCGRVAYMNKGNSYNNLVYNNFAYYTKPIDAASLNNGSGHAFGLGGSSDRTSPRDIGKRTGYEAYNCVYFNNVAYATEPGFLPNGLFFIASTNCYAINNLIINANNAVYMRTKLRADKNWDWDIPTTNPTVKNNIFVNCENGYLYIHEPENPDIANNIHFGTKTGVHANDIVADPKFVDLANGDFHLAPNSPAINAGLEMPTSIPGLGRAYNGEAPVDTIEIPQVDFDGNPRTGVWDIGIYNYD